MAKPVSMTNTVQAIRDAILVTERVLSPAATDPAIFGAIAAVVARKFLDNEYTNDLGPAPQKPRPAAT